jgi:peptidoglycan/xylan/chitin deacetylase (PgdA/CDA1 family)
MDFNDLKKMLGDGLSEIGCHGYYHQPLSEKYQDRTQSELDLGFNALHENLQVNPRYYALANGMYTRPVIKQLLNTFDRVLTIDGRPFGKRQRVVHRMSLINPEIAGPLVGQIDKSLNPARQLKRAVRIMRKMGPASTVRGLVAGVRP